MKRLLACGAVLALLSACSEDPQPPPPPPPAPELSLEASTMSVSPASVVADGAAVATVTVTVMGNDGKPLAGQTVAVSATGEGNVLAPAEAQSDAEGLATFTLASTVAEVKTVSATIAGHELPATAQVTFVPGAAAKLAWRVPPSNVAAGAVISPAVVVEVLDAAGNLVTEGAPEISIALGENPSGATLSGTLTVAAADGVASFSDLSLDKAAAGVTLVASGEGFESVTSEPFEVTAGAPAQLVFIQQPSTAVAGATIAPAIEVAVQDELGNLIADASTEVTLAIANGPMGGKLNGTNTATASQGVARFSDISIDVAGEYTLAVTANGFAGDTSEKFAISPAAATAVKIVTGPSDVEVRTPFVVEVAVVDSFGNVVTEATDTIGVALLNGAGLTGTTSVAATAGVANFADLAIEQEGTGLELEFTADGLNPAKSLPFTVTDTTAPAAVTDFAVTQTTGVTAVLGWTGVGDDGMLGQASAWEIRYATAPINASNFASATPGATGTPLAPGSAESATISGLVAGTDYYFALKVSDSAGNAVYAFASGTTTTCPAGYAGPQCDTCAEGYVETSAGVCEDYCAANDPCNPAPEATCNGNVAVTWSANRTCIPTGSAPYYQCEGPIEIDCSATGEVCHQGACVADPCATTTCDAVEPTCGADGVTLTTGTSVCQAQEQGGQLVGVCVAETTDTDCSATGEVCFAGACAAARAPAAGELIVTEIFRSATPGATWFEVYNASDDVLNLAGLEVEGGSSFIVPASPALPIGPRGYAVFGASAGSDVDFSWESVAPNFALDGAAPLKLLVGTTEIESLDYAAVVPSVTDGNAAALSSAVLATGANQYGWYWCDAAGTPGAANGDCGVVVNAPVDYCRLQPPYDLGTVTSPVVVYSQFYEPSVTDRYHDGNDNYPFLVAELGYGPAITSGTPDVDAWTWVAATPNPAYVEEDAGENNDEVQATLAPNAEGDLLFGYRIALRDPQTGDLSAWTYCGRNGVVNTPEAAEFGTATWVVLDEISVARAEGDRDGLSLPITDAVVTAVRPTIGSDRAGFFIQKDSTGPALFVQVDPTTLNPEPEPGSVVSFTITEMDTLGGGIRAAVAIDAFSVNGTGVIAAQDVSNATDLVSAYRDYESELVKVTGTIASIFSSAGGGHVAAQLDTAGISGDSNLQLRLPVTLQDVVQLETGCVVTLDAAVVWSYAPRAQISIWDASELTSVSCPGPKVVSAMAVNATTVTVTFDKEIDPDTLDPNGGQFTITPALTVTGAALATGNTQVTLTTDAQVEGADYTVSVAGTVTDVRGNPVAAPDNAADFTGFVGGAMCLPTQVVISQVFGGGGNSGAPFTHDFVELHNRSDTQAADIGGWSVQYTSATGNSWGSQKVDIPAGTLIPPGGYFLIQLAGGGAGSALPDPDLVGTIQMSGTNGKVALASTTSSLAGACPTTNVVDLVGFGPANCSEGSGATPRLSNSTAAVRNVDGCADTDDNSADFTVGTPTPRNSASAPLSCGCN